MSLTKKAAERGREPQPAAGSMVDFGKGDVVFRQGLSMLGLK